MREGKTGDFWGEGGDMGDMGDREGGTLWRTSNVSNSWGAL